MKEEFKAQQEAMEEKFKAQQEVMKKEIGSIKVS